MPGKMIPTATVLKANPNDRKADRKDEVVISGKVLLLKDIRIT